MSAHHSRHITNKSVHPEWLLPPQMEERGDEGCSFGFCPNTSFDKWWSIKQEKEDANEESDNISAVKLKVVVIDHALTTKTLWCFLKCLPTQPQINLHNDFQMWVCNWHIWWAAAKGWLLYRILFQLIKWSNKMKEKKNAHYKKSNHFGKVEIYRIFVTLLL